MDIINSDLCECDPSIKEGYKYIQWIGTYFGDCIYTPVEMFSYISGILSIAFYFIAFYPQLYENYKRKSTDGLSVNLFIIWFLGDFTNYAGTVLTEQLPTQKMVGIYLMCIDVIILIQFLYYKFYYHRKHGNVSYLPSSLDANNSHANKKKAIKGSEYEQLIIDKPKGAKDLKKRRSSGSFHKDYNSFGTTNTASAIATTKGKGKKASDSDNDSDSDENTPTTTTNYINNTIMYGSSVESNRSSQSSKSSKSNKSNKSNKSSSDSHSSTDSDEDKNSAQDREFNQNFERKKFQTLNKRQSAKILTQLQTTLLMLSFVILQCTAMVSQTSHVLEEEDDDALMFMNTASGLSDSPNDTIIGKKLCNASPNLSSFQIIVGSIMAWTSGILYFTSRIPQIQENIENKSVDGLSILLFVCTICGNLFYGLSIFTRFPKIDKMFFIGTLPYLIGSVGTFVFDIIIIYQFNKYKKERENAAAASNVAYQHLQ